MSSNTKRTVIHRELITCRRRPLVHSEQPDICGARGPCLHFWLDLSSDDGLILKGKYTRTPWRDPISTRHFLTKQKLSLGQNAFYCNSSRSESHVDSGKCRFWWVHQQKRHKDAHKNKPQEWHWLNTAWCEILSSRFKTKRHVLRYMSLAEPQTSVATGMIKMHVEDKEISQH